MDFVRLFLKYKMEYEHKKKNCWVKENDLSLPLSLSIRRNKQRTEALRLAYSRTKWSVRGKQKSIGYKKG